METAWAFFLSSTASPPPQPPCVSFSRALLRLPTKILLQTFQETCSRTKSLSKNPQLSMVCIGPPLSLTFPLSCFASEELESGMSKINLESLLVSIDNFFTRYPFFVATVAFIWLILIPLTEEYFQKYKYISALNAFKKLQDDPTAQLLDIREAKSVAYLRSPNLRILNKSLVQMEFQQGDEDGFVKRVLEKFGDPADTVLCIIDNFDGNSMIAAELLVKKGVREAYAVRGGLMGQKGWTEIQEALLPPSVGVYPNKARKRKGRKTTAAQEKKLLVPLQGRMVKGGLCLDIPAIQISSLHLPQLHRIQTD